MNKSNARELSLALSLLSLKDETYTDMACRTLATIQRCGTAADRKVVLAVIKEHNISHKFYTDNHCLVAY
jgi:hypothetical protein